MSTVSVIPVGFPDIRSGHMLSRLLERRRCRSGELGQMATGVRRVILARTRQLRNATLYTVAASSAYNVKRHLFKRIFTKCAGRVLGSRAERRERRVNATKRRINRVFVLYIRRLFTSC